MQGLYDTVTLWNRYTDTDTGLEKWVRHVLPQPCRWVASVVRAASGNSASLATYVRCNIPHSALYKPGAAWAELSEEDKRTFFTLQAGDVLALGAHTEEITGTSPGLLSEVLERLGPNAVRVKLFQDNTAPPQGKHYHVEGV